MNVINYVKKLRPATVGRLFCAACRTSARKIAVQNQVFAPVCKPSQFALPMPEGRSGLGPLPQQVVVDAGQLQHRRCVGIAAG